MKKKIRVAILFGGKSAEHEISLISARNIVEAMDKNKYEIVSIGIDKQGRWFFDERARLLCEGGGTRVEFGRRDSATAIIPGASQIPMVRLARGKPLGKIDVVFPVLHGPLGEDGTVQGLLKLADVPFVGAGVLGSAVGMDKDVMKRLLRDARIPIAKFLTFERPAKDKIRFADVKRVLGMPVFVKPANLGSSVGISKVSNTRNFPGAVKNAFRYDNKILIEESIHGREIECAVLGNDDPLASLPGEIMTRHDFYSYDAKYIDGRGAQLVIPAALPKSVMRRIQQMAVATFKILCCSGMARVDFFLRGRDEIFVNEINTIPGFTKISMYPKMWGASGLSYSRLIDRLIQLALQNFRAEKNLRSSI
ncbi:MAG: D-alanine--D-alanine ligase [Deltaproteobacteria bacterium]|nr:D-alanine--D-alanine ligase [Deltaproteobacteria bacterium]